MEKTIPYGEQLKQQQFLATEKQYLLLIDTYYRPLKLNAIAA